MLGVIGHGGSWGNQFLPIDLRWRGLQRPQLPLLAVGDLGWQKGVMSPTKIDLKDVRSQSVLRDWLRGQPSACANVIVARAALRTVPLLMPGHHIVDWLIVSALPVFRATSISWAACSYPEHDMSDAAFHAARVSFPSVDESHYAIVAVQKAVDAAARHESTASRVASTVIGPAVKDSTEAWICLDLDCHWIENQVGVKPKTASRRLARMPLWPRGVGGFHRDAWIEMSIELKKIDPNYSVWIDWYERRIRGERAAFDILGDKYRKEDKKILRRLAEATDEDFWGKGHEYVNAALNGWLDEARERVAPPSEPDIREVGGISVGRSFSIAMMEPVAPLQDTNAIAYGVNGQGKLDRLPISDQVHLRDVPDQRRAYDDLREAAAELLAEGQRLGHRLQRALDRFLHSLPVGFEDAEAYLVWRDANALRRLLRAHREASKSPEPDEARLEPVVAEGLGGLLDLYNNFAFADDGLRAKDEARVAPQERASAEAEAKAAVPLVEAILANPEIATPDALDDLKADIESAELPVDDPYANQVLDQANRTKRNWIAGLLEGARTTLDNPKLLGKRAAFGVATGVGTVIGTIATKQVFGFEYAGLIDFIATNSSLLKHYVAIAFPSFEHLPCLIDQLKLLWAKLRN
jgi:hypothetical protein